MKKWLKPSVLMLFSFMILLFAGSAVTLLAQDPIMPEYTEVSLTELITQFGSISKFIKSGVWLPAISLALTCIIRIFKTQLFGGLVNKIPAETRILIPTIAGFAIGFVALLTHQSPVAAFMVAVTTGPTAVYWHHLLDFVCKKAGWK